MYQCTNVPMYQCTNLPIYQCTNVILENWSSKVSWLTPAPTLPPLQFTAHCKPIVPAQVQYRRLYQCTALMYHSHLKSPLVCCSTHFKALPPASFCTTRPMQCSAAAVYQQTSAVYLSHLRSPCPWSPPNHPTPLNVLPSAAVPRMQYNATSKLTPVQSTLGSKSSSSNGTKHTQNTKLTWSLSYCNLV